MQQLADFLRRHSRKRLSLQRKPSHNKASDFSLRKRSSGKSNNRLQITVVDRHHRSINLNNLSTHSILKGVDVSGYFLKGKSYYKEYKLEEACKQFARVLAAEPEHQQALYLSGISHLNMGKLSEAAKNLQKLQQHNPNYKSNMYLLLSICYNKLKNPEKALQFLTTALGKYQNFLEAYCYRAKIYIGLRKYLKAEEDFDISLSIDPNRQLAIVGKADCLRSRGLYKQAIHYYSLSLQKQSNPTTLLKRAVVYYQNNLKKESLSDIKQLLSIQSTTEAYYYRGLLALDYEKDESLAILSFQQSIKAMTNEQIASKAAQQLLKIKISICDYYECTSILQWVGYQKVSGLEIWTHFVQGVIGLMKKKHLQSETSLKSAELMLQQNQRDTYDYDFLYPLVKLYRAYGAFCLNKYQDAYNDFMEYERFIETVLGKQLDDPRTRYNKLLCEALMLCDGQFYEESIEKLKELIDLDTEKVQPYFYQCMVMLKVAFSDLPVTSQYESRDEIILGVLEIIEDKIHIQNNPSIMYYDGILKAYFNLFQQSQKSLSKAIEKGQQHLAKYFFWRSIVNSQLGNPEQALTDITVSLNIEQKPEYLLTRCRLNQLAKKTQQAYEDLQKYIELEPNQIEVSKWAALILFINKAYQESERALKKIPYINDQTELKKVVYCLNLLSGRFEESGLQGMLIGDAIRGEDAIGLDHLISSKDLYGYLPTNYLYFVRVIKNYALKKYPAAIKDLQYLMFISKENENFLEIKYNIMVCHLLNGDSDKAKSLFKGLQELDERLQEINFALENESEVAFDDLSDYYPRKRLSYFISPHYIPNTKVRIKISMPFPQFPNPHIELKISDDLIIREISLEAVEGKAEAPWIRRNHDTVQFTSKIQNIDVSLRTSQAASKGTSELL